MFLYQVVEHAHGLRGAPYPPFPVLTDESELGICLSHGFFPR